MDYFKWSTRFIPLLGPRELVGTEDDIRDLIQKGHTAKSIVDRGFSKSTVYKVLASTRGYVTQLRNADWIVQNIRFSKERALPGESNSVTFDLTNLSNRNLYLSQAGIQTEWMVDKRGNWYWHAQKIEDILRPMQRQRIEITYPIPQNIALGEYDLRFGLQGQYLPALGYQDHAMTPRWSMPQIVEVKYPYNGETIFLSHSVKDKHLVMDLRQMLENYGFKVIIGEDEDQPGVYLEDKFRNLIRQSSIFIAILTEPAIRSEWVNREIDYAIGLEKPRILLKDKSVKANILYQWTEFDKNGSTIELMGALLNALGKVRISQNPIDSNLLNLLVIAIVSFFIGWFMSRG